MMNQKVGIYIILSAILLYLYYRRNDLAIFAAFVAVVGGTLIFRDQLIQNDDREGFGMGGGDDDKGDQECAKMGFMPIKLDKDDLAGSLEKVMKNIEKVAAKQWPFEKGDFDGKRTEDKAFEKNWKMIQDSSIVKEFIEVIKNDPENKEYKSVQTIWPAISEIYTTFIIQKTTTTADKNKVIKKYTTKAVLDDIIKNGPTVIKLIERVKKSDEIKDGGAKVQKIMTYIMCLAKHWISIFKALRKATGGGGGDDEEEKPKKKKTKKKASEDDEGGGDDEEEEKPKKKKNKKASEDDEE
jgi:hypothetical protein